jgi:ABC-2 type transport system permease protein
MTSPTNGVHEFPVEARAVAETANPTRPLYWSIRREVWENRSIYIAPLIVAAVVMFAFLFTTFSLPKRMRALSSGDPSQKVMSAVIPYSAGASAVMLTGFVVGLFYCADALYGERRDRSILFWKSLPVSDRTAVLSKVAIPIVVIPLITFTISLTMDVLMLSISTIVLVLNGMNPVMLWTRVPLIPMTAIMVYGLTVHALWFAPIYAWLLLLSAWARRAVYLWAVLPVLTLFLIEHLMFRTTVLPDLLRYRLLGGMTEAFTTGSAKAPITRFAQLDPGRFLTSAGLWVGLICAALFLVAAVRLRRKREPI